MDKDETRAAHYVTFTSPYKISQIPNQRDRERRSKHPVQPRLSVNLGNPKSHLTLILHGGFGGWVPQSSPTPEFTLSPPRLTLLISHQATLTDLLRLQKLVFHHNNKHRSNLRSLANLGIQSCISILGQPSGGAT